jgi:hypothetical protein
MRAILPFKLNKSVNIFTIYDYVDLRLKIFQLELFRTFRISFFRAKPNRKSN